MNTWFFLHSLGAACPLLWPRAAPQLSSQQLSISIHHLSSFSSHSNSLSQQRKGQVFQLAGGGVGSLGPKILTWSAEKDSEEPDFCHETPLARLPSSCVSTWNISFPPSGSSSNFILTEHILTCPIARRIDQSLPSILTVFCA